MARHRVVLTGAAGFLGAATARRLLNDGHEVLAWVRPEGDRFRLEGLPSLQFLPLDLANLFVPAGAASAREALAAFRPDAVVHAAWRGTRGAQRDDPAQVENVLQCVEVLRAAAAAGAQHFVGVGSQAEYGPHLDVIDEETKTAPVDLYGAAKLASGHLCLALARTLGMSAAWARVFSVYGPGERSGALIPGLTLALKEGRPFPLGTCEARWDYLYEDDVGEALARLAVRSDVTGIFNLASGKAVRLQDVVARIVAKVAPDATPRFGSRPEAPSDLKRLEANVDRIRRALDWEPKVALDEGLVRTVAALTGVRRGIAATDG